MQTKRSLTSNYIFNLTYQIIIIVIPIILIPFISRTLGPDSAGLYSYSQSFVFYFSYFALLGVNLYGSKSISVSSKSRDSLQKTFFEIFILKLFTSFLSMIVFLTITIIFNNQVIFYIQGGLLIANLLDITWFYTGTENFRAIVARNLIVKISTFFLVLIMINNPDDVWLYALIWVSSEIIGQVFMWFNFIKLNMFYGLRFKNIKPLSHLSGMVKIFIPQLIILLYTTLNVTMIGKISGTSETSYYDMSTKIINVLIVIMTSLSIIIVPRISKLYSEGNIEQINDVLQKAISIFTYLSFPMTIGVLLTSKIFIPWFLGSEYTPAITVLSILSLKIILVPYSNIIGVQYLIPTNQNSIFLKSVILGALINITINFFLIGKYGSYGAAIAIVSAELIVTISQLYFTRKQINFLKMIVSGWKSIVSSLIMGIIVYLELKYFYIYFDNLLLWVESTAIRILINLLITLVTGLIFYIIPMQILHDRTQKMIIKKIVNVFVFRKL